MGYTAGPRPIFTIVCYPSIISPADSTSYYIGRNLLVPFTTDTTMDFNIGYAFTIIGVNVEVAANTTAGTSETSAIKIRNTTQGTSSTVGNFTTQNGSATNSDYFAFTGLNIPVAAGDSIVPQWDTPAWATNPVGVRVIVTLICQR